MDKTAVEAAIGEWLFRYYGLEGSLERLGGENLNFLLRTPGGEKYVFKAVPADCAEESAEMECRLLEHARNAGFPLELPFIIKNYNKNIDAGIKLPLNGSYRSRVISFVAGSVLENCRDISINLAKNVGKSLALFDQAVDGFDHPALHRAHQWELPRAGRHREKLSTIDDPELRDQVAWAFDLWEQVSDVLPGLPHQVIHGDANKENILVSGERVTGFVDFGDACYNPRICELAVCLAYMMMDRDDPLAAAEAVIAGYNSGIELGDEELDVLFPLVCSRLAVSICMATSRMAHVKDNPNWFVSLGPASALLAKMNEIGVSSP